LLFHDGKMKIKPGRKLKFFSRNQSSSSRTRTAGTSICSGSRAILTSSSGNIPRGVAPRDRPISLPPHVHALRLPVLVVVFPSKFVRNAVWRM
jgi:hypothetical protein